MNLRVRPRVKILQTSTYKNILGTNIRDILRHPSFCYDIAAALACVAGDIVSVCE